MIDEPAPEETRKHISYAAHCLSRGEEYEVAAADMKIERGKITLWQFVHPRTWDRCWISARREAAQFAAALATERLLALAESSEPELAARAARAVLVHRRRMRWRRADRVLPPSAQRNAEEETETQVAANEPSQGERAAPRNNGHTPPRNSASSESSAVNPGRPPSGAAPRCRSP